MTRIRVLLVEDESLIRMIMTEVLQDEGLEVVPAADGDEAAAMIDGPDGFDVLLTDIQMPGTRDGLAVGRHFRARHPHQPIVYTSGRPDSMRGADPLGPRDSFLRKPYGPSDLIALLNAVTSRG